MALIGKIKRILAEAFPPPATISLRDEDGIIGVVTSRRFRNKDSMDRQDMIQETLLANGLTKEEMRRVLVIVAVTPEEEAAHTATDL
jgi:hypothetical protein